MRSVKHTMTMMALLSFSLQSHSQQGGAGVDSPNIRLNARLFYDTAHYDSDRQNLGSDTRPTSLRLGVSGNFTERANYLLQWEMREYFKDDAKHESLLRYATTSYRWSSGFGVEVGQTDEPFSLEAMTSIKNIMFMERGLPFAFVPLYHLGSVVSYQKKNWGGAIGVFGKTVGQSNHDEGNGMSARMYASPVNDGSNVLHLGGSVSLRRPENNTARFRTRPESAITDVRLVDTGNISRVERVKAAGLEGVVIANSFSSSAEYIATMVDRSGGLKEPSFNGGYFSAGFLLTGETKPFDSGRGVFTELSPKSKYGAVEVAIRYSSIDLNDSGFKGGKEEDVTLGANWYVTRKIRMMLNYINVISSQRGLDDDPQVWQARFQVDL